MNALFVKSSKSFNQGFILDEQEIRRFTQVVQEQIRKSGTSNLYSKYYLTFKNGTVSETDNIDYVFEQENTGSSQIAYLGIVCQNSQIDVTDDSNNPGKTVIKVEFENINLSDSSNKPIRYSVKGVDKDWVMVTSSLLEERVNKIKRKNIYLKNSFFTQILILSIVFFFANIIFNYSESVSSKMYFQDYEPLLTKEDSSSALRKREAAMANDSILIFLNRIANDTLNNYSKDFKIEMKLQRLLYDKQYGTQYELRRFTEYKWSPSKSFLTEFWGNKLMIIGIIVILLALTFYYASIKKYWGLFPMYNFLIGENIKIFEGTERKRKVILGIILGTILLGLIVNLTSNVLWSWFK